MIDPNHIAIGARVEVTYECRDIGYGVEADIRTLYFRGRDTYGKLIFANHMEKIELGDGTLYLFDDEIVDWAYTETVELPASMVEVMTAARIAAMREP